MHRRALQVLPHLDQEPVFAWSTRMLRVVGCSHLRGVEAGGGRRAGSGVWCKPLPSQGTHGRWAWSGKDGKIDTKPHGHGDVHTLLHQHGCVNAWSAAGLAPIARTAPRAMPSCAALSHYGVVCC